MDSHDSIFTKIYLELCDLTGTMPVTWKYSVERSFYYYDDYYDYSLYRHDWAPSENLSGVVN